VLAVRQSEHVRKNEAALTAMVDGVAAVASCVGSALGQAEADGDDLKAKALDSLRLSIAFTVATKVAPAALHRPAYQHAVADLLEWIMVGCRSGNYTGGETLTAVHSGAELSRVLSC
jgi:hypothetical protein